MWDNTFSLLGQGYAWLPDLARRQGHGPVRTRLLGKPALALRGPAAVRFFYDEDHVRRHTALPEPVLSTLFGKGAVHTLDGPEHRARKALFVSLLRDADGVRDLTERVGTEWDRAVVDWRERPQVTLFDEVSLLLTRAVCGWAGIPPGRQNPSEMRELADDLVAMVDGFATAGPRHLRARRARRRQEERFAQVVEETRRTRVPAGGTGVVHAVAAHRDADGMPLDARTAAVELLNVLRPTVAITWFTVFGAHALHRNPHLRERLARERDALPRAFAHEVRRFYPFAPFTAGLASRPLEWQGATLPEGGLVLLDLYGQNHDPELWDSPYTFDPERFTGREPGRDELVPQGGGETSAGHRCPGEDITLAVLTCLLPRLARLDHRVPAQDLRIPLRRVPTRPRSGFVVSEVARRVPA
ncbi:cytochrome P450 [Streptomyces triticagri]|uniref:Cytochrome P450 n=1 Tax=Streptomyces triticagri TaxID=2293568 RepID=A0A372M231_9ACTN|nr:cytochrome P450 [Streptomyces triticagri]RFU84565.1 cytochrome P450 [Streptomyces triticagri]